MKSERWPVGDPVDDTPANRKLGNSKGYIPGYHDIDGSPTKTFILENKDKNEMKEYFNFSYAKRDAEQLYNISGYFGEADPCFGDIDPLAENGSKNR
ncbi:MAG: hypothetical protein HN778_20630 [Prolixibacteraceae bacterium]|nr:hypothetical protein [Prolixibacteraceae bacterium]MBT7000466.1 hypothetical protein [Prolixibacteraceae bacterium]MBT7397241.1 hypothetical protein [Prolixibacteraceae bacterium]